MLVSFVKSLIILFAGLNYGFMSFDGIRALTLGDYIRPKTGEYAGRLGPWSEVVQAVGVNPESILMKVIFCCYGIIGIVSVIAFMIDKNWAKKVLLIMSFASLWYLVPGTILSVLQIILIPLLRKLEHKMV
jgi:hypothetical protein